MLKLIVQLVFSKVMKKDDWNNQKKFSLVDG
jgi:hypothetical protein